MRADPARGEPAPLRPLLAALRRSHPEIQVRHASRRRLRALRLIQRMVSVTTTAANPTFIVNYVQHSMSFTSHLLYLSNHWMNEWIKLRRHQLGAAAIDHGQDKPGGRHVQFWSQDRRLERLLLQDPHTGCPQVCAQVKPQRFLSRYMHLIFSTKPKATSRACSSCMGMWWKNK